MCVRNAVRPSAVVLPPHPRLQDLHRKTGGVAVRVAVHGVRACLQDCMQRLSFGQHLRRPQSDASLGVRANRVRAGDQVHLFAHGPRVFTGLWLGGAREAHLHWRLRCLCVGPFAAAVIGRRRRLRRGPACRRSLACLAAEAENAGPAWHEGARSGGGTGAVLQPGPDSCRGDHAWQRNQ